MTKVRYIERARRDADADIDLDVLKRRSWPGVAAEFVRFTSPSEHEFALKRSVHCLALLNIYRTDGETALSGHPRSYKKDLRNKMTFFPSGSEITGWSRIPKSSSTMVVYFNGHPQDAQRCDLSLLAPMLEFEDPMLRSTMTQFQALLHDPTLDTPGYAETLGILLAFETGRVHSQSTDAKPPQGGLTPRQVRLVIEYLESRMTDKTSISEMSALVDLSRFHFIRAFKKTVGMPPHQFVVHRRIERARELLTEPDLSVSEVATRTGFNSATQFTRSFRRIVGTTPTVFRRDAL
jgi:AraC family transcriptional regulator